jgi:hypothetical protein
MEGKLKTRRFLVGISNRSRGKKPIIINCNICDTLTPVSCSKIITEIAKYILCSRLIPYPYYALKCAAQNLNCVSNNLYVCFAYCVKVISCMFVLCIVSLMAKIKYYFEGGEMCRLQFSFCEANLEWNDYEILDCVERL